ncbi:imidazoleglycerol-phosphate dehydratase 1, chloroplastic-like [Pistacia vera]|uniref:imidazoleglycerol-phosphate dehydratase 1, chloroplastic-like n=1 Tax=Pistacia vera TaxID=55513 RepID=UPI00126303C5|nr:imidazoleglycerol-phosphate dehydratase 1, chloroplastic-like [Pistacia vera]
MQLSVQLDSTTPHLLLLKPRIKINLPHKFRCPISIHSPSLLLSSIHNRHMNFFTTRASLNPDDNITISTTNNGSALTSSTPGRIGEVKRVTKETNVFVKINLDGSGVADSSTSIPFLDHMLDQLASHGLFDVHVRATGDIHIDDHHTNEDVSLAIGTALLQALGDRKGINRFGDFSAPLDEALIHVSLDLSGRPHLSYDLQIPTERVGTYDTQLVEHFFQSLVNTSGMTLHIRQLAGRNSHHIIEATFKAFARALRQATEEDPRRCGTIPRFVIFYLD